LVLAVVSAFWRTQEILTVEAFGVVNIPGSGGRCGSNNYYDSRHSSSTSLFAALPEGYQEFGNDAIRKAALLCGMNAADADEKLEIQWKAGSIVVTVNGDVSLSAGGSSGDEEDEDDNAKDEDEVPFGDDEAPMQEEVFSLTLLARTINRVLDDDGMGLAIAEVHSIEVTTPGVSDELVPGTPQFDAFKGFEVIVRQLDPKKNKVKTIEGRLVERNAEFTVINIKGRMKKMKNETVQSVRLPKAKKEKGGR
jgi:hypothetical protein